MGLISLMGEEMSSALEHEHISPKRKMHINAVAVFVIILVVVQQPS